MIATFLTDHADFESADLEVSSAKATELHEALKKARADRKNHKSEHKTKKAARDTKVAALKKKLRWTIGDLKKVMAAEDVRWHAFGLVGTNDPISPGVPENLTVSRSEDGEAIVVDWDDATGAREYAVSVRVDGVDNEFRLVEEVQDSETVLRELPRDKPVAIRVTSRNGAGESAAVEGEAVALSG